MGVLLHLIQRGGAWAVCGPAQSPPRCTKCNSQWRIQDFSKEGAGHLGVEGGVVWWSGLDPSQKKNHFVPKMISLGDF